MKILNYRCACSIYLFEYCQTLEEIMPDSQEELGVQKLERGRGDIVYAAPLVQHTQVFWRRVPSLTYTSY